MHTTNTKLNHETFERQADCLAASLVLRRVLGDQLDYEDAYGTRVSAMFAAALEQALAQVRPELPTDVTVDAAVLEQDISISADDLKRSLRLGGWLRQRGYVEAEWQGTFGDLVTAWARFAGQNPDALLDKITPGVRELLVEYCATTGSPTPDLSDQALQEHPDAAAQCIRGLIRLLVANTPSKAMQRWTVKLPKVLASAEKALTSEEFRTVIEGASRFVVYDAMKEMDARGDLKRLSDNARSDPAVRAFAEYLDHGAGWGGNLNAALEGVNTAIIQPRVGHDWVRGSPAHELEDRAQEALIGLDSELRRLAASEKPLEVAGASIQGKTLRRLALAVRHDFIDQARRQQARVKREALSGASDGLGNDERSGIPLVELLRDATQDPETEAIGTLRAGELLARLPVREQEVVDLLAKGFTQHEVAERLGISQPRVAQMLNVIRKKLADQAD